MTKLVGSVLIGFLFLTGCIEHTQNAKSGVLQETSKEDNDFIKKLDFKGFRMYAGSIPCEDCDQIDQRLVLKGDTLGVFRLTETYRNATEDGDAVLVCTGEWKYSSPQRDMIHLSVGKIADSVRTMDYRVKSGNLMQLFADKEKVKQPNLYVLKKIKSAK